MNMAKAPKAWKKYTLKEIKSTDPDAISQGPLPTELLQTDYKPFGIPVIRPSNFSFGDRFFNGDENVVFVSGKKAKELTAACVKADDLVFSYQNLTGQVGFISPDLPWSECLLSHNLFKLRCNPHLAYPKFIYYYFKSLQAASSIQKQLSTPVGSPMTLDMFQQISLRLPDLAEQRKIAQTLADFDERIELNQHINATLEQLNQALFRAWFIDFEPVLAKQAGNVHPTTDVETATLFPNSFTVDSHGCIPTGWHWCSLADYAHYIQGAVFRNSDFCAPEQGLPVVKLAELKHGISSKTNYSAIGSREDQRVDTGDILFAGAKMSHTSLGVKLWTSGPAWLHQHIFRVIPSVTTQRVFTYCLLKQFEPLLTQRMEKGHSFGLSQITLKDLQQIMVVHPPRKLIDKFCTLTEPIFARIIHNELENQTLHKCRTALLAPLMSGRVRV